jgi:hypothetical protein
MMRTMTRKQQLLLFLGGIGLLIAAFLPWSIHSSPLGDYAIHWGYEGNGIITGGIGLLFIIGLIIRKGKSGKSDFVAGSILAILASALLLYNIADVIYSATNYTESGATTDIGSGLCLSVIGAMLIFIGGTLRVSDFPETTPIEAQHNDGGVL